MNKFSGLAGRFLSKTPKPEAALSPNSQALAAMGQEIHNAFQDLLTWQWDDRLEAVLAEFEVADNGEVIAILQRFFNFDWDHHSVGGAPENVKKLKKDLGGIMGAQILFTTDPAEGTFLFCAFWPWGNGEKVSIRIAPYPIEAFAPDPLAFGRLFKVNISPK